MNSKKTNVKKIVAACLASLQILSVSMTVGAAGIDNMRAADEIIAQKTNEDPGFSYGPKSVDYIEGTDYYSIENKYVKASIGTNKATNDQKGPMSMGAIMDAASKTTNRENLDWTQFVFNSKMDSSWNTAGTNKVLDLTEFEIKDNTIIGKGAYAANSNIKGEVVYSIVENTPLIKMEVTLKNEGTEKYEGYFEYLVDPDESGEDDTYVPGVGWNTSNSSTVLTNHEWTENYIFEGSASKYTGYTAHAIIWDENVTEPTGLVNDGYIFGAWFDATMEAGESKTLTFYHLAHDPGGVNEPYSEAAFWAKVVRGEIDTDDYGMVIGTVTDNEGTPISGVDITCEYAVGEHQGETAATASTDGNGNYQMRVEKNVYTLTGTIPGYKQSSQSVDLNTQGDSPRADMILSPMEGVRITQATSMKSFGGLVECKPGDYTIENGMITLSVAEETADSQLKDSSAGRILDIAANGRQDAIDWLFTSWISDVQPHKTNIEGGTAAGDSWIELDTRFDNFEVVSQSSNKVVLKATGVYYHDLANNPDGKEGEIEQIITIEDGNPYIDIETSIRNISGDSLQLYVGDIMDLDINSQKSYAPGIGDITAAYSAPIDEKSSQPWFAQYSTSEQEIYSFLYEEDYDFNVFGNTNWLMGYTPVTLGDGETYSYSRKMVVLDTEGYDQAPDAMNAYYNAYVYGMDASMDVYDGDIQKGQIFPVEVTIENSSENPVKEAYVTLDTPYQMYVIGESTVKVPEIPSNGSQTVEFQVLALEGGRGMIKSSVEAENDISISFSKALSIDGQGYYAGDNHTHSTNSDGSGTIRQNVDSSYEDKMLNWLYSTDHNAISQKDETLAETARLEGNFINITGTEITSSGKGHALAYGVGDFIPEYRIDKEVNGEIWTWQDTIDQVNEAGGIFYVAHPNYPGLQFSDPYGIRDYTGIEVWNGFYHALDADKNVNTFAFEYWDNVNRRGEKKYFGIANSDGHNPGKMADPYIKTELDSLTYENIHEILANGNYYGSNGPELRYDIEGVGMGETLNVEGAKTVDFNIVAFDRNYDLTNIKVIKNVITGSADDGAEKEIVFEEDLTGLGIKEYSKTIQLTVNENEFYRIEVVSEKGTTGDGGKGVGQGLGFAFSNPIWIGKSDISNAKDIKNISYSDGEVVTTEGDDVIILADGEFETEKLNVEVSEDASVKTEVSEAADAELDTTKTVNIIVTAEDGSEDVKTVYVLENNENAPELDADVPSEVYENEEFEVVIRTAEPFSKLTVNNENGDKVSSKVVKTEELDGKFVTTIKMWLGTAVEGGRKLYVYDGENLAGTFNVNVIEKPVVDEIKSVTAPEAASRYEQFEVETVTTRALIKGKFFSENGTSVIGSSIKANSRTIVDGNLVTVYELSVGTSGERTLIFKADYDKHSEFPFEKAFNITIA